MQEQVLKESHAMTSGKKILLHVCCGPCATHSVRKLQEAYDVTLFFSNSNISPRDEYERRLAEAVKLAGMLQVPLIEDPYDHAAWLTRIQGLEREPERGRRCEACFEFNLGRTARYAREHGFDGFTTTLTISPHKDSATIFRVGRDQGPFVAMDFKKDDGFKRSVELAREYGLYRQDYCGCEFSRREET
jgi:predicted adenine nucleotide alpha hydrolase (AANH) superfamily ATPase